MGKQQQTNGEIPEVEVPIPPNPKNALPTTGAYYLSLKYTNEKKEITNNRKLVEISTLCAAARW